MKEELDPLAPIGNGPKPRKYATFLPNVKVESVPLPDPLVRSSPSVQYAQGARAEENLNDYIAGQQGHWDEIANAAVQTASEATLGTIESTSYILDFQQHWNHFHGQEEEYSNWLADAMKEAKGAVEKSNPIYLSQENETFQPGSIEWWMKQSPSVLGSALSLIIPAAGLAKLGKLAGAGRVGQTLLATTASRFAENTMEANQAMQEMLAKGATKEDAASQAANVWNTNLVFAATDFAEFSTLFKGFKSTAKGLKGLTIAEKAGAMAKEAIEEDTKRSALKSLAITIPSEAGEEAGQYITQQEGVQAAVNHGDYFGKGFEDRLADYVSNDEFKTSALLGALGGGVFSGAGAVMNIGRQQATEEDYKKSFTKELTDQSNRPIGKAVTYLKSKLHDLTKEGIELEEANYRGDTGTTQSILNKQFARQAFDKIKEGKVDEFKADIEAKAQDPDLPDEVKRNAKDWVEDLDFLVDQKAKLKAANTDPNLHDQILATHLQTRQLGRMAIQFEKELSKLEGEIQKTGELAPEHFELKKAELGAAALAHLARTNPKFLDRAIESDRRFIEKANLLNASQTIPNYTPQALHTSLDADLALKTFQLMSTREKIKELKKDSYSLTTPEGQASMAAARKAKAEVREAQAIIDNKETTKGDLEEVKKKAIQPEVVAKVDEAIQKKVEEKQEENKKEVEEEIKKAEPEAKELTAEEALAKAEEESGVNYDSDQPERSYDELEELYKEYDTNDDTTQELDEEAALQSPEAKRIAEEEEKRLAGLPINALLDQIQRESPNPPKPQEHKVEKEQQKAVQQVKDKDTVITRLKQIAGKWINGIFQKELDANGTPVEQLYFDNQTGKQVPASEVFDADKHGNLIINTPLIQEGDKVILKLVDNGTDKRTRYSLTQGFTPDKEDNYVIQVFRVDRAGKAYPKPLTELPSADSAQGNDPGTLSALRKAVLSSPGQVLSTTVASKSVGDVRTSTQPHTLEILSTDYVQNEDGTWEYKKTGHNPIIAVVKSNSEIATPNMDKMRGVLTSTRESIREASERDVKEEGYSPGLRFVWRTNALGNQRLVGLKGRNLNEAEITWLKTNMIGFIKSGDIEALSDVLHVKRNAKGIFSTDGGKKERDILKEGGRQFIILQNTKGNPTVLVPLTQGKNHNQWIHLNLTEFERFINGKEFSYQKIDPKDGEMTNKVYSSTKEPAEKVTYIRKALDNLLASSFRNMRDDLLNTEYTYTDPATQTKYETYYQFLVKTETATILAPGSTGVGVGNDNSYSFHNSGLRINTFSNPVVVREDAKGQITLEDKEPILPAPKTTKGVSIKEAMDEEYGKLRQFTKDGFSVIQEKEFDWFIRTLGESALEIIRDVDRILSKGGKEAFGIYHNALVKLAEFAETGTLYHEAFHFLFDPQLGLITENRRNRVLEEARKVYGNKSEAALEESLAEDFRGYQLSGGKKVPAVKKSTNFFSRLYNAIKRLLGFRSPIENLFRDTNSINPSLEQRKFFAETRRKGLNDSTTDEKTRLLPGFTKYRQQVEAVEVSAYAVLNYLWNIAKETGRPVEDLFTGKAAEEGTVPPLTKALEALREGFADDYDTINKKAELSKEDALRKAAYLAMGVKEKFEGLSEYEKSLVGSWDDIVGDLNIETGFKTEVLKQFAKYGFRVVISDTITYEPSTEGAETVNEELTKDDLEELAGTEKSEDIHGIDVTMKDPYKSLSQFIKMFLASIPDEDRKTAWTVLKDGKNIGPKVPIDFQKVFGNLSVKLAGTKVPLTRLAQLADEDTTSKEGKLLNAVYNKLTQELQDGNTKLINEFNTRFNLTETNLVTFLDEYKDGQHTARKIATSQHSSNKTILKKWQEGFVNVLVDRYGETQYVPLGKFMDRLEEIRQEYNAASRDAKKSGNKTLAWSYQDLKDEFVNFLEKLNITLPEAFWKDLEIKYKKGTPKERVRTWLFSEHDNSLYTFFTKLKDGTPITNNSIFDDLANKVKYFQDTPTGEAFMDDNQNQRYPVNLPSTISEFADAVKNGEGRQIAEFYEQDKFYEGNSFLGMLKDRDEAEKFVKETDAAYRFNEQDAIEFDSRTPAQSAIMRLISFWNNGSNYGAFFLGTHEAKAKSTLLSLKKYRDNPSALAFLKRTLVGTMNSEIIRIQRIREAGKSTRTDNPLISDIATLGERGKQFVYIPELNTVSGLADSITNGEVSLSEREAASKQAEVIMDKFIEDQYNLFKEELIKDGVLVLDDKGKLEKHSIPDGIMKQGETVLDMETFLRNFFYNDLAWRFEMSKVLNGDLAAYKSDDDYFKRGYQTVTPGTKPYNDPQNPVTYQVAILKNQALDGVEKPRDSQTVMTLAAWKTIAEPLGEWGPGHDVLYEFAWKDGLTVSQAITRKAPNKELGEKLLALLNKTTTAPIKPFHYANQLITLPGGSKMIVKEQVKDSRAVMNPEFVNRHPEYKKLFTWMTDNEIDIAIDENAVKLGRYGAVTIDKPIEQWQKRTHKLEDLRLPQLNPNSIKTEVSGSQYDKLVTLNIELDKKYNGVTGQAVIEQRNEAWAEILQEQSSKLKKVLGLTEGLQLATDSKQRLVQLRKIKSLLEQELTARNLNENYADCLRIILDQFGNPKFVSSLAFPQEATKFVSVLTNLFKKYILNPKAPGFAGVNFADFVNGQKSDANLAWITNKNGEVVEAEIGMPVSFFEKIGLNFSSENYDKDTGKLKWETLNKNQKEALQGIVYRIPTSNKSSMTPVRIVKVIHPSEGQIVMVPPEMLTQQGLDFDWDKSQVRLRKLDEEGKVDHANPFTRIFNLDWSILTSPLHFEEMMTPLSPIDLKVMSDAYKAKTEGKWMSPMNAARDIIAEEQFRDSKVMVGTVSRFNTAHAVLQTIAPYITIEPTATISIKVEGDYKFDQLGRKLDHRGNLISKAFGEDQSAALDAGNDPILYYLNINKSTVTVAETMLLYGVSPQLRDKFLKQPIIIEWLKNSKTEKSTDAILETTLSTAPGLTTTYNNLRKGKTTLGLSEHGLEKSLDIPLRSQIDAQARVLVEFTHLLELAKTANNLSSVLSIDTFSDMTGIENLEAKINQAVAVTREDSLIRLDPRVLDFEKAPLVAKRLSAFYKYAIEDGLTFLEQFFPYTSPLYRTTKGLFQDISGDPLTNPRSIKRLNQFIDYYLLQTNDALLPIFTKLAPNRLERWEYTNPGKSFIVYFTEFVNKHENLKTNKLISAITPSWSKREGVQMIGINNSNSRLNKTELTQNWRDLMLSNDKAVRTFAYDLVRFAIDTSGFTFSTRSFADLIPIDFFVENGITETHYSILNETDANIDSVGAIRSFIRHNFKTLDEIKEHYVIMSRARVEGVETGGYKLDAKGLTKVKFDGGTGKLSEFTIPTEVLDKREIGNFVKINIPRIIGKKKVSGYHLYESNPLDRTRFREVQPLGEQGAFFEISEDGNNNSIIPTNQNSGSPNPWSEPPKTNGEGSHTPEPPPPTVEPGIPIKQKKENDEEGTTQVPDCSK